MSHSLLLGHALERLYFIVMSEYNGLQNGFLSTAVQRDYGPMLRDSRSQQTVQIFPSGSVLCAFQSPISLHISGSTN